MELKVRADGLYEMKVMMDKLSFTVPKAVDTTLHNYSRKLVSEMRKVIREKKKYQNETNPGRLERDMSIVKAVDGYNIDIYAPYAGAVDQGAQPHTIYPIHGKMLRWERNGEIIFAKKVEHPGIIQPMFFRTTAISKTIGQLRVDIINNIKRKIKEGAKR